MILFIPPSAAAQDNAEADWAAGAERLLRHCPDCLNDSIIGHGRRRKQAHDENHEWIGIRRGLCKGCRKTVTFLPSFSLPYTHYSLVARGQALQRYYENRCSLDDAAPLVKDPNRVPSGSTVGRWFHSLDSEERWNCLRLLDLRMSSTPPGSSAPSRRPGTPFPFLRKMLAALGQWLARTEVVHHGLWVLSWQTAAHFLHTLLPLRR